MSQIVTEQPRMLMIGSRGFLGTYMTHASKANFRVIEANRSQSGQTGEVRIDIRDEASVKAAFQIARPDIALLFAAHSDIDYCEQNQVDAEAVNVRGVEHVANACAQRNVRMVFTSTGAVFDGQKHGYTEDDPVNPISFYGKTKADAERLALMLGKSATVVRIAMAIGFSGRADRKALLDNWKEHWAANKPIAMPTFEQRNPIDAATFSRFVLGLLAKPETHGIFHIGCQEPISRYELGIKVASEMGYSNCVQAQAEHVPGRAPRGPDQYLLTDKLLMASTTPIPTCEQVIKRCFDGAAEVELPA